MLRRFWRKDTSLDQVAEEIRKSRLVMNELWRELRKGQIEMTKELETLKAMVAQTIAEEDKAAKVIASFKAALDEARNSGNPPEALAALSASLSDHVVSLEAGIVAAGDPNAPPPAAPPPPPAAPADAALATEPTQPPGGSGSAGS